MGKVYFLDVANNSNINCSDIHAKLNIVNAIVKHKICDEIRTESHCASFESTLDDIPTVIC